jgi:regulator of CtrA degradation
MSEVQAFRKSSAETPVVLAERIAAGQSFATLFREGMTLVELAAAYLDGPGCRESKQLTRTGALTYATESMRLTTRLMQLASWLLLQRAVNEDRRSRRARKDQGEALPRAAARSSTSRCPSACA